jgi:hypothetical protein
MFDSIKSLYNEKLIKGRLEFDENLEIKERRVSCNNKIPCLYHKDCEQMYLNYRVLYFKFRLLRQFFYCAKVQEC